MNSNDAKPFSDLMATVAATYNRQLSEGQTSMFFGVLAEYSFVEVRGAMLAHLKDPEKGRFMPLPADLIARMSGCLVNDGRPGDDEAWAIARKATDEQETVVWTEEMRQAFGVCRTVLEAGDDVGARMAFKDAYTRLVSESRKNRIRAVWSASLGDNKEMRAVALNRAVADGKMSEFAASGLLPAPKVELAGLLSAPSCGDEERKRAAENCKRLLEMLKAPRHGSNDEPSNKEIERRRAAARGLASGAWIDSVPVSLDDDIPF